MNNRYFNKIIAICLISLLFNLCGCSVNSSFNVDNIIKNNATASNVTITVEKYKNMENFIASIGFKYDALVTVKDYYYYLNHNATDSEVIKAVENLSEDLGVQWSDDWTIVARYSEDGYVPYQYYFGSYKGQPVVYKWTKDSEINIRDGATRYKITGKVKKDYVRLYFVGLYESGMADDFMNNPIFIPCILIEADSIISV